MTSPAEKPPLADVPSAAACAEASAWIARLHGEHRTAKVEAGFKRWLATSAEHRAAFELVNDIWVGVERLPKPATPAFVRWPHAGLVLTWQRALAAVAVFAVIGIGAVLHFRDPGLATRVGEQRNWSLEDGTRISLNTASRVHVHYDRVARRVELDEGEAFFEVAKRSDWPFIVTAGGKQVVALGTAFLVRRDEKRVVVTLVEGKVTVSPVGEAPSLASGQNPAPESRPATGSSSRPLARALKESPEDVTLSPGQRVTFAANDRAALDRPALERVTAWQRGQVILDHTPLADAVVEMNRYSDVELKIEEPEAARAEVTGIFRIGDSENFAQAVAETYQLKIVNRAGQIAIAGVPRPRNPAAVN
jgi:transmembrane sensor